MDFVKTAKNKKIICWDCKKELKLESDKIQKGKMLIYENEGKKITVFKCEKCFSKSRELKNFQPCEVYSRIVGYLRPIQSWNLGKREEFLARKLYRIKN